MATDKPVNKTGYADQTATPTAVTEWKKPARSGAQSPSIDEGFIVDLPSANRIRMRRSFDMTTLLSMGRIPNPLAGIVQKMIDTKNPEILKDNYDAEISQQLLNLMHETAIACVVDPPFAGPEPRGKQKDPLGNDIKETADEYHARINAWECPEGHVAIFDVDPDDLAYIFAVAQGAAADLAKFREEQIEFVADVPVSKGVRQPTKRTNKPGPKAKK